MNDIPADIIQSFIAVFSRLPQRVIWQWKGTPYYNFPANVKTVTWLPQQDLLGSFPKNEGIFKFLFNYEIAGHENCRLFLTHGGLSSLQEAVYHKVPVLGLPVAADQNVNIDKAVETGYALSLQWRNINQNNLNDTIQELLFDKKWLINQWKTWAFQLNSIFIGTPTTYAYHRICLKVICIIRLIKLSFGLNRCWDITEHDTYTLALVTYLFYSDP